MTIFGCVKYSLEFRGCTIGRASEAKGREEENRHVIDLQSSSSAANSGGSHYSRKQSVEIYAFTTTWNTSHNSVN